MVSSTAGLIYRRKANLNTYLSPLKRLMGRTH